MTDSAVENFGLHNIQGKVLSAVNFHGS